MPRKPEGSWIPSRGVWVAALGEPYEDSGGRVRRRPVVLCDPDGVPIGRWDDAGRMAALGRLLAAREAERANAHDPPLAVVLRQWCDWCAGRPRPSRRSDASRRGHVKRVVNIPYPGGPLLGDVPISRIGDAHYHAIRAWFERKGAAPNYIRGHLSDFLAGVRWAAKSIYGREPHRILATNPFPEQSVELPPQGSSDRECPAWPELLEILDALDAHVERPNRGLRAAKARQAARTLALAVRVIGERGARPSEVYELRVEEWDPAEGGFKLDRHKTAAKTGVGALPLRPATAARVQALIDRPDRAGPWVFGPLRAEEQGPPGLQSLRSWWAKHREAVGAGQYQLYSFRNTVSNHLAQHDVRGRRLALALRQGDAVADAVYRRDAIAQARAVFESAGMG